MKASLSKQLNNIDFKDAVSVLISLARKGAVHSFGVSMAFIVIALIFGGIVYLGHRDLDIESETVLKQEKSVRFQDDLYSRIIEALASRQERFQEAAGKSYPDPFYPEQELTEEAE